MAVNIQLRRGTAAEWTAANPTLAVGEIGIETDTDQFKIGNGSDDWDTRPYGGLQGVQGVQGPQGDAATLDVGTTTTGAEGTNAVVANSGTTAEAVFDFTIPQGDTGPTGPTGPQGGFDSTQTIADKSVSYAVLASDVGYLITNSAAITITIDDVLGVGEQIDFLQLDADQITFVAGSGVTLNSKDGNLKTAAQYSPASVKCVASGVYVLVGDLGA